MSLNKTENGELKIHPRPLPEREFTGTGVCSTPRAPGVEVDTLIVHACYLSPKIHAVSKDDEVIAGIKMGDESLARELAKAWRNADRGALDAVRFAGIEERALAALIMARRGPAGFQAFDVDSICDLFEFYGVSAHYIIDREGRIYELVSPDRVAFHAGPSKMPRPEDQREGVNAFSVGVELLATPESGYTEAQYLAVGHLTRELIGRFPLLDFFGHADIAPGRKSDPAGFDWNRFAALAGLNPNRHRYPGIVS